MKPFLSSFFLLLSLTVFSQVDKEIIPPTISLKSGVYKNKITLRWAVNQPIAWQKANKIGFVLKRYTLSRGNQILSKPEEKILGTFLPKPLNNWESIIETNDNAAIVAQSLYGETFEVEMQEKKDKLQGIMNKSEETEQRFAFALMAADLDFEIAKLAGWGYTDNEVRADEKYLYSVSLNTNKETKLIIEKGDAIASIADATDLPKPLDFIAIFQDKTVTLSWEYLQLRDTYTAYFIEKAENGNDFKPMGNLPVVNMNDNDTKQAQGMIYIDSLKQNETNFSYRIRGKTIFGDFGPYSDVVSGAGKKKLEVSPRISSFHFLQDDNVLLNWEFPLENQNEINAFQLIHSETDEEGTYKIVVEKISNDQRSLVTKALSSSNYFKILALGKNNDKRESYAILVQPNDETPPAIPIEFKGIIDSTGVARLEWKANIEKDLEGYHIFRGTQKNEEMLRLTPQAIEQNSFQDEVVLESLNDKVYYYVVAIDRRKNQSEASVILELEKPDRVKPQAPVLDAYKLEENGEITIQWQKSFSNDVLFYQLFKQNIDDADTNWKMIAEIPAATTDTYSFTDKAVSHNQGYKYYLIAIDKSKLQSDKSQEITLRSNNQLPVDAISNLNATVNKKKNQIEIIWKNETPAISEIVVYRYKNNEKPRLLETLNGDQNFLEDKTIEQGNTYHYLLKPMLQNNQISKTEKISVEY